jgi:hypothetical protein
MGSGVGAFGVMGSLGLFKPEASDGEAAKGL